MRRLYFQLFIAIIAALVTYEYAASFWMGDDSVVYTEKMIGTDLVKPFVYRQFFPFIARTVIHVTAIRADYVVVGLTVLFGVAFTFAMAWFLSLFLVPYSSESLAMLAIIALFCFVLLFENFRALYDLPTALFFTLALGYLASKRKSRYFFVFTIASTNRETAILLVIVFIVAYIFSGEFQVKNHGRYALYTIYQILAFLLIQIVLRQIFIANPGTTAWIRPVYNLRAYLSQPFGFALTLLIAALIAFFIHKTWHLQPVFLKISLAGLSPIIPMHFIFGGAFEFRSMIEIYPVIFAMLVVAFSNLRQFAARQTNSSTG